MLPLNTWFSPKEAAVIGGVAERFIRHEIEIGAVRLKTKRIGKVARFLLTDRDIYYFVVVNKLDFDLRAGDRRDLHDAIVKNLRTHGRWKVDCNRLVLDGRILVRIETGHVYRKLAGRLRLYVRGRDRLSSRPDILSGEPVFEGTRIPVRHVGILVRKGVPVEDILEDYPALTADDVEFAHMFAAIRREPGRPRITRAHSE